MTVRVPSVNYYPQHICSQKREGCAFLDCILIMTKFDAFTSYRTKIKTTKWWFLPYQR